MKKIKPTILLILSIISIFTFINISFAFNYTDILTDKDWNKIKIEATYPGRIDTWKHNFTITTIYEQLNRNDVFSTTPGVKMYKHWNYTVWCTNGFQLTLVCEETRYTASPWSECTTSGKRTRTWKKNTKIKAYWTCNNNSAGSTSENCTLKTISSTIENNWGTCNLSWFWSKDTKINCIQTNNKKRKNIKKYCYNWAHCSSNITSTVNITPKPTNTVNLKWFLTAWECIGTPYANNSDSCNIKVNLNISIASWNIKSRNWWAAHLERVRWINWTSKVYNVTDQSLYSANIINWTDWSSNSALNFPDTTTSSNKYLNVIKNSNSNYFFNIVWIKSRAPITKYDWKINFLLKWKTWWNTPYTNYQKISWIKYNFKKPYSLNLSLNDSSKIEMLKEQKYNLKLNNIWNINWISNWKLYSNNTNTKPITNNHYWVNTIINNFSFWSNPNPWAYLFNWTINSNNEKNILDKPTVKAINLPISYNLGWNFVKYNLDGNELNWCEISTLWLKVTGIMQWSWRSKYTTSEWANFSNMDKFEYKTQIRKNAYKLIRNRNSETIVNWVKYVEWNANISGVINYETIIVKNWNIIISNDITTSTWKPLWIIVISDWYNVMNNPSSTNWNIYINNNVSNINAVIYSDWAFMSANSLWSNYSDLDLWSKLTLKWSLFSRNTIWGSVKINNFYKLPWNITVSSTIINKDLSKKYDLNNIRKVLNLCWENFYSFLIEYDPSVQSNPPKWFEF